MKSSLAYVPGEYRIAAARRASILFVTRQAMLEPFQFELRKAIEEFCRRFNARAPKGYDHEVTPAEVLAHLHESIEEESRALWIATDDQYRLLGFLSAMIGETSIGHRRFAIVTTYYLWPKKLNLSISTVLNPMLDAWAREQGVAQIVHTSSKDTPRAWGRLGYHEIGKVYGKPLRGVEGS